MAFLSDSDKIQIDRNERLLFYGLAPWKTILNLPPLAIS